MTYQEAAAYLDSFVNYECTHQPHAMRQVRLERMRRLCARLGDPQRRFRSVLVTGTNGKGSICAMLYSMLRETSLRVGLYTSPHLEHLRERIRVWDGRAESRGDRPREHGDDWIGERAFASLVERLQPALEGLRHEPLTYFEALTALAFAHFRERQVEIAVLEVGLGGRLDATNAVDQAVSVIAPIALDHTDILGPDPASIAREKAGIVKPRQVVVTAPQQPAAEEALRESCGAQGISPLVCGKDVTVAVHRHGTEGLEVSITGLRGRYESLRIPLIGRHQAQNAVLAVGALEALSTTGVPRAFVEQGLPRVEWPGRFEIVSDAPVVVMDGAHNPHAAEALRDTLLELWPGRAIHLLIGMSSDKPVEEVGRLIGSLAVSATCTRSRHPRALEPTELARRLAPWCPDVRVMADPIDAYTYLINAVPKEDVVVVTGSLFLVGELRAAIRRSHVRPRRAPQLEAVVADGGAA
jgi:dihydrofolate synthase/folylpolyglutamate synthase